MNAVTNTVTLESEGQKPVTTSIAANDTNIIELPVTNSESAQDAEPGKDNTFQYQGRTYQLYKRIEHRDAPWQIRFEYATKQHRKSLETNVWKVAVTNAKIYIDSVKAVKWEIAKAQVRGVKAAPKVAATMGEVEPLYRQFAKIGSIDNNVWAMGKVLKTVFNVKGEEWKKISLDHVNELLVVKFQNAMIDEYRKDAEKNEPAQRQATELAKRSSKSIINQARSFFNKDKSLVKLYTEAGLYIPPCVTEFMTVKVQGKIDKGEYLAPPDSVVQAAFTEIGKVALRDPNVFIAFWFATGAGLRRGEIRQCRWEYLVERNGITWISGGIGKDGKTIEVPMQKTALEALAPFRKAEGRIMGTEMGLEFAKRLNSWMKFQGWNTEKKMHELRAYVGSLIYQQSPLACMRFMRHKSIAITEKFYVRYGKTASIPDVL
jgi:integrase